MKIVKKTQKVYDSFVEQYELNDMLLARSDFMPGSLIVYLLSSARNVKLLSFYFSEETEIGGQRQVITGEGSDFCKQFQTIESFMRNMTSANISEWELNFLYQNQEVVATGRIWSTIVGISYSATSKSNLIPLLYSVEEKSYEYHTFDKQIVRCVMERFELKVKAAIKALLKLSKYTDIYSEFTDVIKCGKWMNKHTAISVEGFTAEQLNSSYPLSLLGAYNYLIFLRESPNEALEALRKGLPRY